MTYRVVTCYVLYLTATEIISVRQPLRLLRCQCRNHLVPDIHTGVQGRFLKINLIEEPSFKSLVHVLFQVRGGYEDAVERLHLLKDDVLYRVLHLLHSPHSSLLPFADYGIGFIEKQDRSNLAVIHLCLVEVKKRLDVLLAFTHPHAFYLRHIHLHYVAACLPCQLQHRFRLPCSRSPIEEACEAATESALFHAVADLVVSFLFQQLSQLFYPARHLLIVKQFFRRYICRFHNARNFIYDNLVDTSTTSNSCLFKIPIFVKFMNNSWSFMLEKKLNVKLL